MAPDKEALNARLVDILGQRVQNDSSLRQRMLERLLDNRRDIDNECGYPKYIDAWQLKELYDREAVACRVVQLFPKESWQVSPQVYEDEDETVKTSFEEAWEGVVRTLRGTSWFGMEKGSTVWEHLLRVDILSGIGHFGILLLGFDDGQPLDTPVEGSIKVEEAPLTDKAADALLKPESWVRKTVNLSTKETEQVQLPPLNDEEKAAVERWKNRRSVPTANLIVDSVGQLGTDAQYWQYDYLGLGAEIPSEKPSTKKRKLLFLRAFDETMVQVVRWESNPLSPRFDHPVMYRITLHDPRDTVQSGIGLAMNTVMVHWSRVLHIADNLESSETMGTPRQRPVLNDILNIRKVKGAAAEGYWKSCFMGLSFETHPALGGDVNVDGDKLRDMLENYWNGLDRGIYTSGMGVKTISPSVVDPTPHLETAIESICIQLGCPVRVFKGSERGELASSQDDSAWNDRLRHRQNMYITPRIIVPFVDRLILVGVLPAPGADSVKKKLDKAVENGKHIHPSPTINAYLIFNDEDKTELDSIVPSEGYSVEWDDLDSLSDAEKATIAATTTGAIAAYIQGGVENLIEPHTFLTKIIGWSAEEADAYLDAAEEAQEEKEAEQQALADEHGLMPAPPPGFMAPEKETPPNPVKVKDGEKLVDPRKITGNKYTFDAEDCPKCGASMEGDPDSGKCNSCGHEWGTLIANAEFEAVCNEFNLSPAEREQLRRAAR